MKSKKSYSKTSTRLHIAVAIFLALVFSVITLAIMPAPQKAIKFAVIECNEGFSAYGVSYSLDASRGTVSFYSQNLFKGHNSTIEIPEYLPGDKTTRWTTVGTAMNNISLRFMRDSTQESEGVFHILFFKTTGIVGKIKPKYSNWETTIPGYKIMRYASKQGELRHLKPDEIENTRFYKESSIKIK